MRLPARFRERAVIVDEPAGLGQAEEGAREFFRDAALEALVRPGGHVHDPKATIMSQMRPSSQTTVAISSWRMRVTTKPTMSGIATESRRMTSCGTFGWV